MSSSNQSMTLFQQCDLAPVCAVVFALLMLVLPTAHAAGAGGASIDICHFPPGNPGAAHSITINQAALVVHMGHGDSLGQCAGGGGSVVVGTGFGAAFVFCDTREGEQGRVIGISGTGRVTAGMAQCD